MSSKVSLIYAVDEASGITANLTEECLAPESFPVTLELSGIAEFSLDVTAQGNHLTVEIPRTLAQKLGLLPNDVATTAEKAAQ